jgi:hypothetical protein
MLPAGDSGSHPAKQQVVSMRSVLHSDNIGRRMTAMRNRNS